MFTSFVSKNPYTRQLIKEIPYSGRDAIKAKIDAVDKAYKARRKAGGIDRSFLKGDFEKLASVIESKKDMIAKVVVSETGKPVSGAMGEITKAIGHIKYYGQNISELTATKVIPTDASAKTGYYIDPLGVIFKIVPFNFPFWTPIKMMIPTLTAGNGVIVRPAQSCPLTGLALQEVFQEAGFDNVDIVFSSPEDTDFIMADPAIQGLSFTGSSNIGRIVAASAAKNLKRTVLELGGNDAFIVLADADVEVAASTAVKSRLNNCGQVCNAGKRFIVHKSLVGAFIEKLEAKVKAMKTGDPMDPKTELTCLARDDLAASLWQQVDRAIKGGDQLLFGGVKPDGAFFEPTAFKVRDVKNSMLMKEELFGPVFSVIEFETDEEAIEIANSSQYGLGATLMTKDLEKAEHLIRQIDAGMTFVNSPVSAHSKLPSGATKESGYGRDCGTFGVEAFANIKTFSIKK
jgi:succinate-semialdehyde dehydrogenase/glutarate-semialdehyde dehydrogenase